MWRTIVVVLLFFTYSLAQDAAQPDVYPLPVEDADAPAEKTDLQVMEDLWGEDKGDDYNYDDWSDFEEDADTREEEEADPLEEDADMQVEEKQVSPVPVYAEEKGKPDEGTEEQMDPIKPWGSTPEPSLWGSSSDVAEEPSDIVDDLDDLNGKYWTNNDDLFDDEAGDYSSESNEDPEYPADLGEYEDIDSWPGLDSEVDSEVDNQVGSEVDSESNEKDVDSYEDIKPTPTPAVEEYGKVVEGRKRGVFTVWHYAIFAIAGAIFVLGLVVIVGAAIKAVRQPNSSYRRLADPTKV